MDTQTEALRKCEICGSALAAANKGAECFYHELETQLTFDDPSKSTPSRRGRKMPQSLGDNAKTVMDRLKAISISDRNREIFVARYGLGNGWEHVKTLEELGTQFGLTPQRIHKIVEYVWSVLWGEHETKEDWFTKQEVSVETVITEVARAFGVSVEDIMGDHRFARVALARQVAMYILKTKLGHTLSDIAHALKREDHTTVLHGVRRVKGMLMSDTSLQQKIAAVYRACYPEEHFAPCRQCGAIVFRRDGDTVYFALVLDFFGRWTHPKGYIGEGETDEACALRKTREEIGLQTTHIVERLGEAEFVGSSRYGFQRKQVKYFLIETSDTEIVLGRSQGFRDAGWFSFDKAVTLDMYPDVRQLWLKAVAIVDSSKEKRAT